MLLAIDTSGKSGGIALANYDGEFAVILGEQEISGGTFSAQLVPEIAKLLAANSASLSHLTAIAAITGPGSFTGLRIGLAAVKGICEIYPLPIVPVTMLELLAAATNAAAITTLLDAGRGEAYIAAFHNHDGIFITISEQLLPLDEIHLAGLALTPDAVIATNLGCIAVPRPTPTDLALYAVRKLARGVNISADQLDAHYIRRSDAEIFATPRVMKR